MAITYGFCSMRLKKECLPADYPVVCTMSNTISFDTGQLQLKYL